MVAQKQQAKKAPQAGNWLTRAQRTSGQWVQQLFGVTQGWHRQRDIVQNNYELGLRHFKLAHFGDAVFRLKLVVWLNPDHAEGWYYLGRSYVALGKMGAAAKALSQASRLRPGHEETVYMLAVAQGNGAPAAGLPKKMPLALAREHFEASAAEFNRQQLDEYGYQGHVLLDKAVRSALAPGRMDHRVLELGVGTGLCGAGIRDIAAEITGVDMSQAMLSQAMGLHAPDGRKIYDALILKEVGEYLPALADAGFDVVLAAGLLSYIGELEGVFKQAARVLKGGGVFAFTADKIEGEEYRFVPEAGRFAFSKGYLEGRAKGCGMTAVTLEEAMVYPGYGMWVCVFRK